MNVITVMKTVLFDEKSLMWWKYISVIRIYNCNEISSLLWTFSTEIKFDQVDAKSLMWWKITNTLKMHHRGHNWIVTTLMNWIHHFDGNTSMWWKLITVTTTTMWQELNWLDECSWNVIKIDQSNENLSLFWKKWDS